MGSCQRCHRPIGRAWIVCGWCAASQVARSPRRGLTARAGRLVLNVYGWLVVASCLGLAIFLARQGWSMEKLQFLGLIWPGVILMFGLLVWANASIRRARERTSLFPLRHGRLA